MNVSKSPIYKHTELRPGMAERYRSLFESTFAEPLKRFNHGNRQAIGQERLQFATEQYANRVRVAGNMGASPLDEDAAIFGKAFPQYKSLFESITTNGNVIGVGNVVNPMEGNRLPGGMANPNYKPGSGDVGSYVFGLQGQLALHCQSFDLLPTIAVDTPKVTISYVDTVYGGGKFTDAENLPTFIEVKSPIFTRNWVKASKLVRAKSTVVIAKDATGGEALEVRFITGSTIGAALTVEVIATGTFTGTTFTQTHDKSVMDVIEVLNKVGTTGYKVFIAVEGDGNYVDATKTYKWDKTNGTWDAGTVATPSFAGVDYASATRQNIAEAATNNNSRFGMDRAQHEKGPKHKLNVVMFDKQLEMIGIEIEADTNNIEIKDLAAAGVNVLSMLYAGVQNQLIQSLDEIVLNTLYRYGVQHALSAYESQGINHSLYIDSPSNEELDLTKLDVEFEDILGNDVRSRFGKIQNVLVSATNESQMTHANRLYQRILLVAEFVAQQNRFAAPDWLVASGEICSCLKANAKFIICPVNTNLSGQAELYYTGTIFDTISVYKNVKIDFNDPRILLGVRGDATTPGLKLLAYDLASSRQTVAEDTMSDKIRVWSRFNLCPVGFYPELNYYCMVAINKYQWA